MLSVDLNCDMGEGCGNDAALMRLVSSANIACGAHAGDAATMKRTIELALENGVAIGAHPGYADRANFGRIDMDVSVDEVSSLVKEQVSALAEIAGSLGTRLTHVKPHGALYNRSACDRGIASAIAQAVMAIDPDLALFGLSGSQSIAAGQEIGLKTASEVFADRTYRSDGSLTPRSEPNALLSETEAAVTQALDMVKYGRVRSTDGIMVRISADTICLHGDGEHAVDFAEALRARLAENSIAIKALNG